MVSPLLCGVGFRLLPALISASSSELSPVGDIMLKDLVPARRQERRRWPGVGPAAPPPPTCPLLPPPQVRAGPAFPWAQRAALQVLPLHPGSSRGPQRRVLLGWQPVRPHHPPGPTHGVWGPHLEAPGSS